MKTPKLIVTKESKTGRNIEFKDTRTNKKMTDKELISRLKTGTSSYNKDYCVKTRNGVKYVASKPDGNKKNNLG